MHAQRKIQKSRIAIFTIVLCITGLGCQFLSGGSTPNIFAGQSSPQAPPVTQAPIPTGWKISKDSGGTCQVATPPDWKLGSDFFLGADKADPGPFEGHPGKYPPIGAALWKDNPGLAGHYFQSRRILMSGDLVCSVWRIQADTAFTDAQERELDEVGKTLQKVQ